MQVVLDSSAPQPRLNLMLEQSGCTILVTNSANLPSARQLSPLPELNVDEVDGFPSENPDVSVEPGTAVAVSYTSGSTGLPKGIVWNHQGVLHAVMRHTNASRMCQDDRLVMFRPSLRGYLYPLLNGAAFYPVGLQGGSALGIADWMIQERVTVLRTPVSTFRAFASTLTGAEAFPHLRLIIVYGEPVHGSDVELYRKHFRGACALVSTLGCSEFDDYAYYFVDQESDIGKGAVPGGYPIGDTEVLFLGEDGRPVADGEIGEIVIRSRHNAVGYWRRPDLTQAAFLPDLAGGDARLYRTGDLGRKGADGCIFHLGRTDFQVKIRGYRVDVAEVEAALRELDHVEDAVVVGREDTPGDRRLVAYVMVTDGHTPAVGELRRVLVDRMPDYMVPSRYVVLETFPRTATGKIDRRALPPPDGVRPAVRASFVPPRTPVEERLAAIWAEVLRLDRVGVYDSFLELGGDSLLATLVVSRVIEHLHVQVSPHALLAAPTVAEMAEVILHGLAGKLEMSALDRMLTDLEARNG